MASQAPTDSGVTAATGIEGNDGQSTVLEPSVTPAPALVPAKEQSAEVTAADLEAEFGGGDASPGTDQSNQPAEAGAEGGEAAGAANDPPVKQQTAEERIAELVAQLHEEKAARLAADAEVAKLKPPAPEENPAAAGPKEEAAPDPANYEFGEADTQFIAANAAYHARKAVREELAAKAQQDRENAAWQQLETTRNGRYDEGRAAYQDFDAKVIQGADKGEWPCTPEMAITMIQSPVGHHVAYHLANNVAEAKRIAELPEAMQVFELGMLAGRFSGDKAAVVPPKASAAPPPPSHLARGEGGKFAVPDDTDDFKAFEAKVDAKLAAKR